LPILLGAVLSCKQPVLLAAGSGKTALPSDLSPMAPGEKPAIEGSGINGAMVSAWGNAPANPPTYECVKIFDAAGQKLLATGTCSGTWGQFSIPLPPGRYIVVKEGTRTAVDVAPGQWVNLSPREPPARFRRQGAEKPLLNRVKLSFASASGKNGFLP